MNRDENNGGIFKPEHEVIHHFVSGTPGKELPDEVRRLTPGNQTGKYDGDVVRPTAVTTTRVHVDGGSWVFTGWNNDSSVIDGDDVVFTGGWRFMEDTYIDIAGVKTWIDNDDALGKRPGSITVNLLRNGEVVDQRTVTADMDWAYAFEHLRETDEDGKAYAYTIAEVNVPGYFVITKDYDLINTLLPQSADLPRRNAAWSKPDFSGYTREELSDLVNLYNYQTPLYGGLLSTGDETPGLALCLCRHRPGCAAGAGVPPPPQGKGRLGVPFRGTREFEEMNL